EALALAPDHPDATLVKSRALEAVEAGVREELARRAGDTVREARRRFSDNDHEGALHLLAAFDPKHELVSNALEELRAESLRIAAQRRLEAEQRAKRQRIDAELVAARAEIERRQFAEALERLRVLQ